MFNKVDTRLRVTKETKYIDHDWLLDGWSTVLANMPSAVESINYSYLAAVLSPFSSNA